MSTDKEKGSRLASKAVKGAAKGTAGNKAAENVSKAKSKRKDSPAPDGALAQVRDGHAETPEADAAQEAKEGQAAGHRIRFPIVGIGASAGGLEALQEFFSGMPPHAGIGFVVVTHLHPGHVSLLPELLGKFTRMPVVEAADGVQVAPNYVYVMKPGGLLTISEGKLRLARLEEGVHPAMAIDHFLRSLAADQRDHAICIVLSGTGTDGTLGMRAIKAESGMAMVQEPASAKYSGMPSSATATGLADYVLPVSKMPRQIEAYVKGPYFSMHQWASARGNFPPDVLRRIMALLRTRTGHDFSSYKANTIRRRIERRMNIHQINEGRKYAQYLEENPHEIDVLFTELLINVTSFFRDREAFDLLGGKYLPELIEAREDIHVLRVWVPGCATGEEAYSIAILLHECMEKNKKRLDVQMFATDLDPHAIEAARAGVYSAGIATDLSQERIDRYFTREDNLYRIRKEIREMIVFAPQNVIKDPPFTKLDLIACRNVLIYLDSGMQRRVLPIFHYALRRGGLLFLGPSETVGALRNLFDVLDQKWKILRRREGAAAIHPILELPSDTAKLETTEDAAAIMPAIRPSNTNAQLQRVLLGRFAPPTAIVDERGSVVYIHGRTGAYLEPSQGQPRNNLIEMAREGLAQALMGAIRKAASEKVDVTRENVRVKSNGGHAFVNFTVSRIEDPDGIRGLLMVTFTPSAGPAGAPKPKEPDEAGDAVSDSEDHLERELQFVKESLQTTIEELETSNEELKSTNEELQSTNEELETSKEELQSLNEELTTVNAELQSKVDELAQSNNDMQNLLNSTQVATIFLDKDLNVKRYTERAKEMVNLIPTDLGRPLSDLTPKFDYGNLFEDCREVLRTLAPRESEIFTHAGARHLMRILPYRTTENMVDGAVLTFVDVDRLHKAEAARDLFESIVETSHRPHVVLDADCRVLRANRAFYRMFEVPHDQVEGALIFELGNGQWEIPQLHGLLEQVLKEDTVFSDFRVEHNFPRIGKKVFLLDARGLPRAAGKPGTVVLSFEEASD